MNIVQKNIVSLLSVKPRSERGLGRELDIPKYQVLGRVKHINRTTGTEIGIVANKNGKRIYSITMVGDRRTL